MGDCSSLPPIDVLAVDSIDELADCLPHRHPYFTLLLAWDAPEIDQQELIALFRPLVDRGLACFSAWGNRSEEVHDAVDLCFVERELEVGEADYLLMTGWHANEPLEEAVWAFKMLDIPSELHVFAEFDRFAVAVENRAWVDRMERTFAAK
jgi:hypothetical protein